MAQMSYISGNKLKALIGGSDLSGHQAWISSDREICLGRKVGEPEYVIDFGSEKLIPVKEEVGRVSNPIEVAGRRSGEFRLKILGREFLLGNLKRVVKTALLQFYSRDDAFLKRMKEVCPRTKFRTINMTCSQISAFLENTQNLSSRDGGTARTILKRKFAPGFSACVNCRMCDGAKMLPWTE